MDELEEKLNISEDFANIDDLLDDDKDADKELKKNVAEEVVKNESSVDDDFDHDCVENDMSVHVGISKVPKTEDGSENPDQANVFSSGLLDDLLGQKMEIAKREIFPTNLAMGGISEVKDDHREVIEQQLEARETLEGLRAGLGQQQKSRMKMRMQSNSSQCPKVKTLAMKREKLAEDIMRYGVAAIERLYPRQQQKQQNQVSDAQCSPSHHDHFFLNFLPNFTYTCYFLQVSCGFSLLSSKAAVCDCNDQARRKSTGTRRDSHKSPYKMKPAPHDIHFEEVKMHKFAGFKVSLCRSMQRRS